MPHHADGSPSLLSSDLYDAYGARQSTDSNTDPYGGFGGQFGYYTDAETGLVLCTHRYYDPANGRWLTRDPIGYIGGVNLYGYCSNNPVNRADPRGYTGNLSPCIPPQPPIKPLPPPTGDPHPTPIPAPILPHPWPGVPILPSSPPSPGDPPPGVPDPPTGPGTQSPVFGGSGTGTTSIGAGENGGVAVGVSVTGVIGSGPVTGTVGIGGTVQPGGGNFGGGIGIIYNF